MQKFKISKLFQESINKINDLRKIRVIIIKYIDFNSLSISIFLKTQLLRNENNSTSNKSANNTHSSITTKMNITLSVENIHFDVLI